MRLLTYAGLALGKHKPAFEKVRAAIERDDFKSPDLKKLASTPGALYRAKLDYDARLLIQFVQVNGERAALALDVIEKHAYDRSRFLRGARIDEARVADGPVAEPAAIEAAPLRYVHPERAEVHYLDKPISFDDAQARVLALAPPVLLVGTAGSGKTALTLERLRAARGDVLYVTQSAYLAQNARALFFAHADPEGADDATVEFMSHRELVESVEVPRGRAVTARDFAALFERHKQALKFTNAHACFEEIRGVLGARPDGPLGLDEYLALGVRQSVYGPDERRAVHAFFADKYRAHLEASGLYDPNFVAHALRAKVTPRYDFAVVDEVQDLTNAELALVLAGLRKPGQFVLAGDANQVVHPNFFSWAGVRALFFDAHERDAKAPAQKLAVLDVNFRNARAVTRAANRLLRVKQARFGSIDRESNLLVRPVADVEGSVAVLRESPAALADLDRKTSRSTRVAVIVLRDEHKAEARKFFKTPLVFSVHEAKGLEYERVILFRFLASERKAFVDVCEGVGAAALDRAEDSESELAYARARDKGDKSLEAYKFYVNALYVALTRAVEHALLVEPDVGHPVVGLLGLREATSGDDVRASESSVEEWQREARKLELQGKAEQAEAIRKNVLRTEKVPWAVADRAGYRELADKAFAPRSPFTKAKQQLLAFASIYDLPMLASRLEREAALPQAAGFERDKHKVWDAALAPYRSKLGADLPAQLARHGVDFRNAANLTPLMLAVIDGNVGLAEKLVGQGARIDLVDTFGNTAAHWALQRARREPDYARGPMAVLWELVAPPTVDVRVGGRLVKVGREQGEYFFLMTAMTVFRDLYRFGLRRPAGLTAELLSKGLEHLPENVLAGYRRKRPYVNSVLARSALGSKYTANRKLWQRFKLGSYELNPEVSIAVPSETAGGESTWMPLPEALGEAILL